MGTVDATDEPVFGSIGIVGLGLVGGSIALAVRNRWPSMRIVGLDRASALAHAAGSGVFDRAVTSLDDLGAPALIVLAAPVQEIIRLLPEFVPRLTGVEAITDVGGTKRRVVETARPLSLDGRYIGGHPIGGAERGGFGFARPDLFAGQPWILTPDEDASPAALERLCAFVRGLGAKPSTMTAAQHDQLMAFVSHLPQLTSTTLMDVVGTAAGQAGLEMAGRGLSDTTRLASSPSEIWRDICDTNPDEIGKALDVLIARLTALRADIDGSKGTFEVIFEAAARWRADLIRRRDSLR